MSIFTYRVAETAVKAAVRVCVKDNIAVAGMPMTCASPTLPHFYPDYTAACLSPLHQDNRHYQIVGKCNLDEFGMGSTTSHSTHGPCPHPFDSRLTPGGSSGGCAAAVALGMAEVGVGSDTGGSVRLPAAFCGLLGFKPAFGCISRHGLVGYAPTLDTIGLMVRSGEHDVLWRAYELMRAVDSGDMTRVSRECDHIQPQRIVLWEDAQEHCDPTVWRDTCEFAKMASCKLTLPLIRMRFGMFKEAMAAYYVIACIEAWSSLQRFPLCTTAVTHDNPFYPINQTTDCAGFGGEVERRLRMAQSLLKLKTTDAYKRASQIRNRVSEHITSHHQQSIIITPTAPTPPPSIDTSKAEYDSDVFTVPFSLAGVPAWSVPLAPGTFTAAQLVHANPHFIYSRLSCLSV